LHISNYVFFVFSQNRGRRGSDEILRQALAKSEAEREITGRAYITLKAENQDLLRENRDLKDKLRVSEGKQRDLETKNRELDGKYRLSLGKGGEHGGGGEGQSHQDGQLV
jgi:hypothetical protein